MFFFKTIRNKIFFLLVLVGGFPLILFAIFPYTPFSQEFDNSFFLIYIFIFVLLLASLIALSLSRRFYKLVTITQKIKKGDFSEKIPILKDDEVGMLAQELNFLFDRLHENQEKFSAILQKKSQNLVDSERKHRRLVSLLTDVVYEVDAQQTILEAKHIEKLLGYTETEVIGLKFNNLVTPEDRPKLIENLQKNQQGTIENLKLNLQTKSGEIVTVLLSCQCLCTKGKLLKREGTLRDITEQEKLSQKVNTEKNKLKAAYLNLHQSYLALGKINAQVAALAEINTTFSSNLSWKDKLNYIIESIRAFTHADEALIFIRNERKEIYTLKKAPHNAQCWQDATLDGKTKNLKSIIQNRTPLKVPNLTAWAEGKCFQEHGFQEMLIVPVIINNEVVALFFLLFQKPESVKDISTKLTLTYTSQMAIALMMSGELDHSLKKIF